MEVKIRPLEEKDAYTSVKWRNIPEIWKYTASAPDREITIEDELNWIKKVAADLTSRRFAILANDIYVGNIYLTDIEKDKGEFHIFIGERDYWGKGIAKKASEQIIEHGKEVLGLKKIVLAVKKENAGAFKLYKSLGFEEESKDGDFVIMGLDL